MKQTKKQSGGRKLNLFQKLWIPILFGITFWALTLFIIDLQNSSMWNKINKK